MFIESLQIKEAKDTMVMEYGTVALNLVFVGHTYFNPKM